MQVIFRFFFSFLSLCSTYLLSDLEDKSQYYSSQHFWDSALNPCIPSTATFIIKVIKVKNLAFNSMSVKNTYN